MELVLRIRLKGVGPELLGKVGQRLIGPAVQWIARVLVPVGACPLIPNAAAKDSKARSLRQYRRLAIFPIAVVLVHSAGDRRYALLDDLNIARSDGNSIVGLRAVHRGGLSDWSGVGKQFRIVVVIGVRLHFHIPAVSEFGF